MWYVVRTITGQEDKLLTSISRVLNGADYERCFVIRREGVWRIEGTYRTYVRPAFPSYVFVETATPEEFFLSLKRVPRLSRLLRNDCEFWTVSAEEQVLLERMTAGGGDLIRRSPVWLDAGDNIVRAGGALAEFTDRIVRKRLRKRCVVVEIPFLGGTRRVEMGIRIAGREGGEIKEEGRQEPAEHFCETGTDKRGRK